MKSRFATREIFLEFHGNFFKIAGLKSARRRPVFTLIKKDFSDAGSESIARQIDQTFKEYNLPRKKVTLNISRHLVMARFLNLPSTDEREIKSMVDIEALKHIPYRGEEIAIEHSIIEKREDGYSDVLLAIVQCEIINRFIDILKKAGIRPVKVTLSSEALLAWCFLIKEEAKQDLKAATALVNIGAEYIDIDIVESDKLKFARAYVYDTTSAKQCRMAADEISKSIATYGKIGGRVDKIIISGAGSKIDILLPFLKESSDASAEVIPQGQNRVFDKRTAVDLSAVSFVGLIGLALKGERSGINFLPRKLAEDNRVQILRKTFIKTAVLLTGIILAVAGLMAKNWLDRSAELTRLKARIEQIRPLAAEAKRMRESVRIIKRELDKKPLAVEVLTEVYRIAPAGLKLNLLDYRDKQSLILRGDAPALDVIVGFVSRMEGSEYLENVEIKYTTKRSAGGRNFTDFQISCLLSEIK